MKGGRYEVSLFVAGKRNSLASYFTGKMEASIRFQLA
jgi:hypothetical protein